MYNNTDALFYTVRIETVCDGTREFDRYIQKLHILLMGTTCFVSLQI